MPPRPDMPRDLLFGLLALQNALIDQDQLLDAFRAWTRARGRTLAEILVDRGDLDFDQRGLLDGLAAQHLRKHGGDAEKSLAAIGTDPSTREVLARIGDPCPTALPAGVGTATGPIDDPSQRTATHVTGSAPSAGPRFRVLRPHAQGGLGFVSVALDAELNREVALKQILERHADDPDRRTRFLIEAEITGNLEHPGIVPVYGLGRYDDGRPYYAMRFIRGDSLKEAIAHFHADAAMKSDPGARSLALRKLLRRFVDVCNAIEYAHSRGVLHRDIKPGNVIVGKHGETLVVDWGLAKPTGRADHDPDAGERTLVPASASGSAETLPGSAVGTPAYMSPEQAAGDLDRLGPRSDVYSLGATLYSLLTGKPPFVGGDIGAVLRDVQQGRFSPPRAVAPTIDPALEAVCLKAMATDPEGRHASPKALAEDVERWAADEPVSAWREPLSRRARRWARRHRTTVTSTSTALLMALVGLAGVLSVQSRANTDLNAKNGQLTESNRLKDEANANLKAANERVQARFDLAQEAIHAFQATVTEDQVLKDERFHGLRDKLLRSAAEFYGKLGALLEGQADRRSRLALARAYRDLGYLTANIGVKPEALAVYRKELAVRRELAGGRDPGDVLELAKVLVFVGKLAHETGNPVDALASNREAGELAGSRRWPAALDHDASSTLARSHNNSGVLLASTGEPAKALESYARALAIQQRLADANPAVTEFQADLAYTHNNIGSLLDRIGGPGKALESFGRSLAIQRNLAEAHPADTRCQADLATSHNNIGHLLDRMGEPDKALESFGRAVAIQRKLAEANPAVTRFQADLARSHNNIGALLGRTGGPARALESYGRALAIQRKLAEANPAVTEFQADLAASLDNIGQELSRTGERVKALESSGRALAIRQELADANPADTEFQAHLATSHDKIASLLGRTGEPAKALESYARALAIHRNLAEAHPGDTEFQDDLAMSHNNIGVLLGRIGEPAKALESYGRALAIEQKLADTHPAIAEFRARLAMSHHNIGLLLAETGEPAKALESHGRALAIRRGLAEARPTNVTYQKDLLNSLGRLARTSADLGRRAEANASLRQAVAMEGRLPRDIATLYNLACYQARLAGAALLPGSGLTADEARAEGDRAVMMLRRAVAAGFRGVRHLRDNPDFDPIRSRPDFRMILLELAFPAYPFAR